MMIQARPSAETVGWRPASGGLRRLNLRKSVAGNQAIGCIEGAPMGFTRAVRKGGKTGPERYLPQLTVQENAWECKPRSSPRYTPVKSFNPLTHGRFNSKIHMVRQAYDGSTTGCLRADGFQVVCLLVIDSPATRFPPRPPEHQPNGLTYLRHQKSSSCTLLSTIWAG
jgi:hypothetical protein